MLPGSGCHPPSTWDSWSASSRKNEERHDAQTWLYCFSREPLKLPPALFRSPDCAISLDKGPAVVKDILQIHEWDNAAARTYPVSIDEKL